MLDPIELAVDCSVDGRPVVNVYNINSEFADVLQ